MPDEAAHANLSLELAHVLFMDIVGYSRLPMAEQEKQLRILQDSVRKTQEFIDAQKTNQLICLPTGDGMALVFFGDPEAPARCAVHLDQVLRTGRPAIRLRMGLHSGPVYRVADINANRNVAGGGINIAQRVMDCGDAGHILASATQTEILTETGSWKDSLSDLGEVTVKHGVKLRLHNLCADGTGNPAIPMKIRDARTEMLGGGHKKHFMSIVISACVVLSLIAAAVFWLLSSRGVHALADTDTVVLADFANHTGDAVFDDTLKQALTVELMQSPFLNILSDQKVQDTLKLMGHASGERVTPDVARDLCQRTGSKVYVGGSIASLGSQYVVGLNAVNCQTGDSVAQEQMTADGKEQVLKALGKASTNLRGKLGESLSTIQRFDVPIEQATTPSLEALKTYTLARRAQMNGDERTAIALGKRAVELDPNFATGYQSLARSYGVANNSDLAIQNEKRAYELRNRVSERERLSIEAEYQLEVTGNLEKAVEAYELLAATYPRDPGSAFVLGTLSTAIGQHDKAIIYFRHALDLDPKNGEAYALLASAYRYANRGDDARSTIEMARRQHAGDPIVHYWDYMFAFLQGNADGMTEQVTWSIGKPGYDDVFLSLQASTAAYGGKLKKAREFTDQVIALDKGTLDTEVADAEAFGALREAVVGNFAKARKDADAALALFPNRDIQPMAASAMAFAGDTTRAMLLADDLEKRFPEDTLINVYFVPTIRAVAEINQGNPAKAIEILRITEPLELAANPEFSLYAVYVRGQAYLAAKQGNEAAVEFQKILDHAGIVLNEPIGALAHLQIGRAYVLQGDTAKARAAYQEFLTLWKDADADIPSFIAAKSEYAKLK
jgi:tetratricopeptide (TPR) repeat protein/class 3 adenylate cyclase